jgi:TIR domain
VRVTYRVEVLQTERPEWSADLQTAVQRELRHLGVHRAIEVAVSEGHTSDDDGPRVAIALLGPGSTTDSALTAHVRKAVEDGMVVIPVVDDLTTFQQQAPVELAPFNAFAWSGSAPDVRLARVLLEELGIEERERRIFISHRRSDGLGAAEQLHDSLTHNRFRPFIDRFAVPFGGDVQVAIADALEDFAFLLLLETAEAHLSDWVFDEVDYALAHTMGVLIVQWPGDPQPIPGSAGIPRLTLQPDDLATDAHGYDVLNGPALDRVLHAVEAAHAQGLVRRRRMLLLNAQDAAEQGGAQCIPLTNWCLDVAGPRGRTVVAVAPRLPDARDLQRLDEARRQVDPTAAGILLHAARRLTEARSTHLRWVAGDRDLTMIPDNRIGGHW